MNSLILLWKLLGFCSSKQLTCLESKWKLYFTCNAISSQFFQILAATFFFFISFFSFLFFFFLFSFLAWLPKVFMSTQIIWAEIIFKVLASFICDCLTSGVPRLNFQFLCHLCAPSSEHSGQLCSIGSQRHCQQGSKLVKLIEHGSFF